MYIGLFLVSKYILDKYSPIIPIQNSCIPLIINMIHTKLGHPATGSPYISVLIIINIIIINDIKQNVMPITADNTRGVVEKAAIPSIA